MAPGLEAKTIEGSQTDENLYEQQKNRNWKEKFHGTTSNNDVLRGGDNMLLNIILVMLMFAVFGSIAHRIMGGGGSLMHLVFVGGCGYFLSHAVRTVFALHSIHIAWILGMDIAASCIVVWIIRAIQVYLIKQKIHSDDNRDI